MLLGDKLLNEIILLAKPRENVLADKQRGVKEIFCEAELSLRDH